MFRDSSAEVHVYFKHSRGCLNTLRALLSFVQIKRGYPFQQRNGDINLTLLH